MQTKVTIGSKYLVRIADEEDTIGIFKGYCALGGDTALVIEMDGGKIRIIPVVQVVLIDILDSADPVNADSRTADVNYV